MPPTELSFDPQRIERPDRSLLWYYVLVAAATGPLFPITFLPLFFKYETLRYRFDDGGVSMSWGILFRREVYLTYRRIQDIHLTRNLLQRWMGLATVAVQTASGSATPEMSIEGVLQADALRDHLYREMRGAKGEDAETMPTPDANLPEDEALALLREIRDALNGYAAAKPAAARNSPEQ
ncbi:MAG: PH domain-containing protein [Planctomycetaceae bacterium]|nr:PH domain-containing protein [Planctomycetaceae bacterium]